MAASPDYDRVASVLVAIALRLVEHQEYEEGRERVGEGQGC
jgi:hypothetical protein